MPDTNDQTIANPQSLVDAALGSTPPAAPPVSVPPVPEPVPVVAAPIPPTPPAPAPEPAVAMGDETPLAFAAPGPAPLPPVESAVPPTVPPAALPNVPPAPVGLPKKKSKLGVVVGGMLLLVISLGGGIGGYWYYNTQSKIPDIQCNANNGYCQQINKKQASEGGYAGGGTGKNSNLAKGGSEGQAEAARLMGVDQLSQEQKDAYELIIKQGKGLEQAANLKTDYAIKKAKEEAIARNDPNNENHSGMYPIDQNGDGVMDSYKYILGEGIYETAVARAAGGSFGDQLILKNQYGMGGFNTNEDFLKALTMMNMGYTWVPGGVGCNGTNDNAGTGLDINSQPVSCTSWHFTSCLSGGGVNGIGCDVKTPTEPKDKPPSDGSSMACTGLTQTPVAPVVGSTVTFTCTGIVTPAVTNAISYKYRYSINNGPFVAMTNNTLTVAACGTYKVECQACATLSGVLTCAPVWSGATQ